MERGIHRLTVTASTNDDVHRLAEAGAPDGTVVVADRMTAGRGSRGRAWHAGAGGVWVSVLRRPAAAIDTAVLSLRVGIELAGALEPLVGRQIDLKWPNDLFLGQRKVGGILCEMRWHGARPDWLALGVGVNVANRLPDELRPRAASLTEVVAGLSPSRVRRTVLEVLRNVDVDAAALDARELGAFDRRHWLRGRAVVSPVRGSVAGIDEEGKLHVTGEDGVDHTVSTGALELDIDV